MRAYLVKFFLTVTFCLLQFATAAATPYTLQSKEGRFSIQLPSGFQTPEFSSAPIPTAVGQIETMNYTSYSDKGACMVGASEYPSKIVAAISSRELQMLQNAQEGVLKNMDATLLRSEPFAYESNLGSTAWFTSHSDGQILFGKIRLICAMPRLYHILYLTDRQEALQSADVEAYFASFLLK